MAYTPVKRHYRCHDPVYLLRGFRLGAYDVNLQHEGRHFLFPGAFLQMPRKTEYSFSIGLFISIPARFLYEILKNYFSPLFHQSSKQIVFSPLFFTTAMILPGIQERRYLKLAPRFLSTEPVFSFRIQYSQDIKFFEKRISEILI